jgi:hypothetical protein
MSVERFFAPGDAIHFFEMGAFSWPELIGGGYGKGEFLGVECY